MASSTKKNVTAPQQDAISHDDCLQILSELLDSESWISLSVVNEKVGKQLFLEFCDRGMLDKLQAKLSDKNLVSTKQAHRIRIIDQELDKPRRKGRLSIKDANVLLGLPEDDNKLYPLEIPKCLRENGAFVRSYYDCFTLDERRRRNQKQKKSIAVSIKNLLLGEVTLPKSKTLILRINSLWSRTYPTLLIDGGTTNEEIGKMFSQLKTPSRNIASISIVTNSSSVGGLLNRKRLSSYRQHDVITVGGCLRTETGTHVGILAVRSWKSMNIQPDMSIIAATGLNSNGEFSSSHPEESYIKTVMLGERVHNSIRCVALDSSKILAMIGTAWPFCAFEGVDMITTDSKILEKPSSQPASENYATFWNLVELHQTPVLIEGKFHESSPQPVPDIKRNHP